MSYKTKALAQLYFVITLTMGAFGQFSPVLAQSGFCDTNSDCGMGQSCRGHICISPTVPPDKTAVAPEPPIILLLGLGLAGLILWQWKYARKAKS